jgi:hypothetical protein
VKRFPQALLFAQPSLYCISRKGFYAAVTLGVSLGAAQLYCQTTPKPSSKAPVPVSADKIATIKSVRIIQEGSGDAVEILSTKPLVPSIRAIADPDRLVIDLRNALMGKQPKYVSVLANRIQAIRADQFRQNPPMTRVVVDLLAPRVYHWDAAGNRIVVHLGKNVGANNSPFRAPTVVSLMPAPQPVVTAVRAAGPLTLSNNDGSIGSSFTAGPDTAVLRLSGGGEVHVCPGTTVSVTPSRSRHNLMLGMNTGALEAHFALDSSSDSVMTPDFRIQLAGPGEFHYAVSADRRGNTCVRALPGNTASAIVSELLGDRTYQVKATDQVVFRLGRLDRVDLAAPLECGCPPPREPPMRAASDLPKQSESESQHTAQSAPPPPVAEPAHNEGVPAVNPPDASVAVNELHVQIEAPFVFHARGSPPAPVEDVRALPMDSRGGATPVLGDPLPPPANQASKPDGARSASANRPPSRGFFRKVGGAFAALFR